MRLSASRALGAAILLASFVSPARADNRDTEGAAAVPPSAPAPAAPAPAPLPPDPPPRPASEPPRTRSPNAPGFTFSLGGDYTFWTPSFGQGMDQYSRAAHGDIAVKDDAKLLSAVEVRAFNLAGLTLRVGYATDKFQKFFAFGGPDDLEKSDAPVSRVFNGSARFRMGSATFLDASVALSRFEAEATQTLPGAATARTYLPASGDPVTLSNGQKLKWFSASRDILADIGFGSGEGMVFLLGYRNVATTSPNLLIADGGGATLAGTNNRCSALHLGLEGRNAASVDGFQLTRLGASVTYGKGSIDSPYFDGIPTSCFGYDAGIAFGYRTSLATIELGFRFTQLSQSTGDSGESVNYKKALTPGGAIPTGSVNFHASHAETFYGPYLRVGLGLLGKFDVRRHSLSSQA